MFRSGAQSFILWSLKLVSLKHVLRHRIGCRCPGPGESCGISPSQLLPAGEERYLPGAPDGPRPPPALPHVTSRSFTEHSEKF